MKHTDETKRKLSEMRRGERNPFYGRKHTPETRARLNSILRQYDGQRRLKINRRALKNFSEIDAAYLAAMIDGEGSIAFRKGYPQVVVYNTCEALMFWLIQHIGGSWRETSVVGRVPVLAWSVQGAADIHYCLTRVRPHLIIKPDRADHVLAHLWTKYGELLLESSDGGK